MPSKPRAVPPGASEQDKLILKYLSDKVDPIFVPLMRTLIQKVNLRYMQSLPERAVAFRAVATMPLDYHDPISKCA